MKPEWAGEPKIFRPDAMAGTCPGMHPLLPGKLSAVGKKIMIHLFIAVAVVIVVVQTVQNKVLNLTFSGVKLIE